MRIFIVGATGVLGRTLIPLLREQGHTVRALVRDRAKLFADVGMETMVGDLLDASIESQLPTMLNGCNAAVHIATAIPRNPAAPAAWQTNNRLRTEGTRRLLDAALAAGVSRYIQQSIVMAYADGDDRWLDESAPFDTTPARASVALPVMTMEAMIREVAASQLQWCILRGGAFVGPGTAQENLITQLLVGQVVVPDGGSNFISPIHVADMAVAVIAALERASAGSTFNIVDTPQRYGDYVDNIADRLDAPHPQRDPNLPTPSSWRCTNQAAREMLGWTPTHSIWPNRSLQSADSSDN